MMKSLKTMTLAALAGPCLALLLMVGCAGCSTWDETTADWDPVVKDSTEAVALGLLSLVKEDGKAWVAEHRPELTPYVAVIDAGLPFSDALEGLPGVVSLYLQDQVTDGELSADQVRSIKLALGDAAVLPEVTAIEDADARALYLVALAESLKQRAVAGVPIVLLKPPHREATETLQTETLLDEHPRQVLPLRGIAGAGPDHRRELTSLGRA